MPSRVIASGAVGFPNWTRHVTTTKEIDRWSSDPRLGVCIRTAKVRALDIDVDDERAAQIADEFTAITGALPLRFRANSHKHLLAFIVEGDLRKRSFKVDGGLVELLAGGQHFVVDSIHPSGVRYGWRDGLPADIPALNFETFEKAWAAIVERFAVETPHAAGVRLREESFAAEDPVANHLDDHGLVIGGDDEKLFIRCPWAGDHSGESGPSETAWLVAGSSGYSEGHFQCQHASCAKRTDSAFFEAVGYVEDISSEFDDLGPLPAEERGSAGVSATPYQWRDASHLPMRPWVYGRQLLRGTLSVLVAPGASGKTALLAGTSLALATGRPLLGKEVHDRPQRVWLWNLEDSGEELARLIQAACLHWELTVSDLGGRLFVDSALDGAELCIAVADRNGVKVRAPVIDAVVAEIVAKEIDVLIVDPFVSSHRVPENDNGAIDAIAKQWARVAVAARCSVLLAHHTSKTAGAEVTAEKARGAVALVNAARSVIALNRMTAEEAGRLGITEGDRRRYFRAYDDKNNRAPPAETSDWFKLESVALRNAPDPFDHGDDMQVVVPWSPPSAAEGIGDPELARVQEVIASGEWRKSEQSPLWAGRAVAEALGLNLDDPGVRQRVRVLVKRWLDDGSLRDEMRPDANRIQRPFILVGRPAGCHAHGDSEADCTTCASVVQIGDAADANLHRTTRSPLGGGGGAAVQGNPIGAAARR